MNTKRRSGFTLIEILIVVVIMAVLAATIIPQFTDSTDDARESTAVFNLNTLRAQIQLYKAEHGGVPSSLTPLTQKTNKAGTTSSGDGALVYGPYMMSVPENTVNSAVAVKTISTDAAASSDVTADDAGGWIYSTATGNVYLDHSTLYAK